MIKKLDTLLEQVQHLLTVFTAGDDYVFLKDLFTSLSDHKRRLVRTRLGIYRKKAIKLFKQAEEYYKRYRPSYYEKVFSKRSQWQNVRTETLLNLSRKCLAPATHKLYSLVHDYLPPNRVHFFTKQYKRIA